MCLPVNGHLQLARRTLAARGSMSFHLLWRSFGYMSKTQLYRVPSHIKNREKESKPTQKNQEEPRRIQENTGSHTPPHRAYRTPHRGHARHTRGMTRPRALFPPGLAQRCTMKQKSDPPPPRSSASTKQGSPVMQFHRYTFSFEWDALYKYTQQREAPRSEEETGE